MAAKIREFSRKQGETSGNGNSGDKRGRSMANMVDDADEKRRKLRAKRARGTQFALSIIVFASFW